MKFIHILSFLLAFGMASCFGGKSVVSKYYILDYPAELSIKAYDTIPALPKICKLNMVEVLAPYSSHQIAVRENTHQITFFTQNEWAVRPEQSLTQIALTYFKKNNVFESVTTGSLILATDYALNTKVSKLEVINEGGDYLAHISADFILVDSQKDSIILEHNISRTQALDQRSINLFANVISVMFTEELEALAIRIVQEVDAGSER